MDENFIIGRLENMHGFLRGLDDPSQAALENLVHQQYLICWIYTLPSNSGDSGVQEIRDEFCTRYGNRSQRIKSAFLGINQNLILTAWGCLT